MLDCFAVRATDVTLDIGPADTGDAHAPGHDLYHCLCRRPTFPMPDTEIAAAISDAEGEQERRWVRVLRPLGLALIAAWSLLILVWLALHWIILPHIDQWREPIERRASAMLGQTVRIGEVIVTSRGWVPAIELRQVELLDARAAPALSLPRVVAALSVHSLLTLQPRFEQLFIDGAHLEMRRDRTGHLFVAGLDVSGPDGGDRTLADWFFKQHEFVIRGGTLRWTDEMHAAAPLSLTDVQLVVRNSLRRHDLRIDATPPAVWGERFTLMAQFTQPLLAPSGDWRRWKGTLFASFPLADMGTLRQHLALPIDLEQGQGALRAWINLDGGQPEAAVLDVALRDVSLRLGAGLEAQRFSEVTGRVTGRHGTQGRELAVRQFGFVTGDGVRWPASNLGLSWRQHPDGSVLGAELSAERLDLALMSQLAQRLPIEPHLREQLIDLDPQGIAEGLDVRWDDTPPARFGAAAPVVAGLPAHYQLRVALKGLSLKARPSAQLDSAGRPGVRQADVDIKASEKGGEARVSITQGALDLPGVFADPLLPLDRLSVQLGWRVGTGEPGAAPPLTVQIKQAQLANADLQADWRGSWSTGGATAGLQAPRFPGVLDIDGTLSRVVGTRVARYMPLGVGPNSRTYVEQAVRGGHVPGATFRVKGDLDQFPFANASNAAQGEFSVVAQVEDATLAYVPSRPATDTQPAFASPWPPLEELGGELRFDRASMEIRNARGRVQGIRFASLQGGIKNLEDHSVMQLEAAGRGATVDLLRFINSSPVGGWTGNALALATGSGSADLKLSMALPLSSLETSTLRGSVTLGGGELRLRPDVPLLSATRGRIDFTQKGFGIVGGAGRMLGGAFTIDGGPQPDGSTRFTGQGTATAEGLRRGNDALGPVPARLATSLTGQTPYRMTLGLLRGKADLLVTSNLVGLASDLPAPFQKTAESPLALRYQVSPLAESVSGAPARDTLRLDLGGLLQTQFVRDVSGDTARVLRGGIGVLEPAPKPAAGVAAALNLAHVSLDPWERLFDSAKVLPAGAAAAGDSTPGGYFPSSITLRAQELQWGGRRLNRLVAGLSQEGPLWRANVDAEQVSGYIEYGSPRAALGTAGRVYARLTRLSLPRDELADIDSLLDPVAVSVPALDVVVDDFMLRGKSLGRMEMEAVNRGAGEGRPDARDAVREWRLTRLALTTPEARLSASGNWAALGSGSNATTAAGGRRVVLNFKLDLDDSGALLERLGYGKVLRGGKGAMAGQLAWVGSPLSLDFPSLSGQLNLAMASGQFLKADPGVGRLLGVLSLQALPRRLLLDFRDVFQQGFAFDDIGGDLQIAQGVARTNNLRMRGVQAAVLMEGHADIAQETQDLRVVVVPELNAGTASLAYAAINPALGLGSFLAQALLRKPLMAANTREFHVTGPWADPKVDKIDRKDTDETPAGVPPASSSASSPAADSPRTRP